jgi:HK97 family phage major capsid protein
MIRGSGAGQPLGILNADSLVSVAKETGQAAATVVYENVLNMFARIHPKSLTNASWFINQEVYPQLWSMVQVIGVGGVPVFLPPGGVGSAPGGTLLGRPVVPIEYASALGTVGDIILADWSQYVLLRKGGIEQASSIHVYFDTDETAFRWVLRINGRPWRKSVVSPYKGSLTTSPFVVLQTRA